MIFCPFCEKSKKGRASIFSWDAHILFLHFNTIALKPPNVGIIMFILIFKKSSIINTRHNIYTAIKIMDLNNE